MSHFKLIRSDSMYESPMHEDNGLSIGELSTYLCSATATKALDESRPAGRRFNADNFQNEKWYYKFIKHTGEKPEYLKFAKGESGRWYAQATYF